MQPVKPAKESNHMWSVTRSSNKKLVESASDKNSHTIRSYQKTIQCLMTRYVNLNCVLTRTVMIPNLCSQWNQEWICGQCQYQQNYNLSTRKRIKWNLIKYPWMMTRTVNLMCVLTRTVKKLQMFICSQWLIQVICSYPKQHYHTSAQDCIMTRTVKLQDVTRNLNIPSMTKTVNLQDVSVSGKSVQWDQCAMTRTVNPSILCEIWIWRNSFHMRSVPKTDVNRLGHSLKYLGTFNPQASAVSIYELVFPDSCRCNLPICSQWEDWVLAVTSIHHFKTSK